MAKMAKKSKKVVDTRTDEEKIAVVKLDMLIRQWRERMEKRSKEFCYKSESDYSES